MIYRHYKGGLYYTIGYATRFSKEFPARGIEQAFSARYTEAENEEQNEIIAVLSVIDEKTGSMYYAYDTNAINGLQTFYKDLDGNFWLRPLDMFNGVVKDGTTRRFTKVKGEELFDMIYDLKLATAK